MAEDVHAPDRSLQLLTAEYEWVAGLIRYYREVELKAIGGVGLLLSGVAAAFAALESAEQDERAAEALFLAIAAWVPAFLLVVLIVALVRGLRAVLYVRERLQPRAVELTGDPAALGWERGAGSLLEASATNPATQAKLGRLARGVISERFVGHAAAGTPGIAIIALTSVALALAGILRHPSLETALIGGAAAAVTALVGIIGAACAQLSLVAVPPSPPSEPEATQ